MRRTQLLYRMSLNIKVITDAELKRQDDLQKTCTTHGYREDAEWPIRTDHVENAHQNNCPLK